MSRLWGVREPGNPWHARWCRRGLHPGASVRMVPFHLPDGRTVERCRTTNQVWEEAKLEDVKGVPIPGGVLVGKGPLTPVNLKLVITIVVK